MTLRSNLPVAAGATSLAAFALLAGHRFGVAALVVPLLAVLAGLLIARPGLALGLTAGLLVAVEIDPSWGPVSFPSKLYVEIPGAKIVPAEMLVLLSLLAALIAAARRGRWRPARPFGGALATLAFGMVIGVISAKEAGVGGTAIISAARPALPVMIMPFVVTNALDGSTGLRRALGAAAGLSTFKAVIGLLALAAGLTAAAVAGTPITYLDAPPNALMMGFLLVVAAAAVMRERLPAWVWVVTPVVVAALLLSYRRSFWIATVAGLVLVAVLASGQTGRRLGIPAITALAVAFFLTLGSGALGGSNNPAAQSGSIAGRVASLSPSALNANAGDRYRIEERRNVLASLDETPIAGLGFGVTWTATSPLSTAGADQGYVHFGALWWWMKEGILGLLGYAWLMYAAVYAGIKVWRLHPDRRVRAAGLGMAMAVVGMVIAETTATFIGVSLRTSILFGVLVGLLAVAYSDLPSRETAASLTL